MPGAYPKPDRSHRRADLRAGRVHATRSARNGRPRRTHGSASHPALALPIPAAMAHAHGSGPMSLALLGLGTAVPPTAIDQATASDIAVSLCCRTPEHRTWLPVMYQQSGIRTRHLQFDEAVVRDIVTGTRHSGSPFLPTGRDDDA